MKRVALTVDVEPDCPPYMSDTFRGITEGMPRLLDLLDSAGTSATCFTTAVVAERYPDTVAEMVARGHELGSHGVSHTAFDRLDAATATREIRDAARCLRAFAPVTSFRAPYLRFPERYLGELVAAGFSVDSSVARYKASWYTRQRVETIRRVPASITSSWLRGPRALRDPLLRSLRDPVVLFVHPWEFVDLTRTTLRLDCRFRTGPVALQSLRDTIALLADTGATFVRMRDFAAPRGRVPPAATTATAST